MNVNPRIAQPVRNSKAMVTGAFVRNAWYVAMWGDDLPREQVAGRTILNEAVALFRKADGSVAALADRCAHRFAPLHMGKVSPATAFSAPTTGWNSTAPAPACSILMATSACRRAPECGAIRSSRNTGRSGSGWATSRPTSRPFRTSAHSTRRKQAM